MTKMLEDIRREPAELSQCLARLLGSEALSSAASILNSGHDICVVGIGSSWNAALGVATLLSQTGFNAVASDASELLNFGSIRRHSTVIMLSRSGRTVEIAKVLTAARSAQAQVIAITNTEETPLAREAAAVIQLGAHFDHLVSIGMYSLLAFAGALLTATAKGEDPTALAHSLRKSFDALAQCIPAWCDRIAASSWLSADAPTYFLARGSSVASCQEARLLWEEAAKSSATALTTGGFRHGSQEMIQPGVRIGLWLNASVLRAEDLQLATELRLAGASVLLIGTDIPQEAGDLVMNVPAMPSGWQFINDIVPIQIAAEQLSRLRGENCDAFRYCSYVIETLGGLSGTR